MASARILAFSGSLRRDSWNGKLVRVAARGAEAAGAMVTLISLRDYPLPAFNADDEEATGVPESARRLATVFKEHTGLLLASPEYNGGFPGHLKNVFDWLSRPVPGEKPFGIFANKPAAIMAASPGAFGGIRMLPALRQMLSHFQFLVIPQQQALPKAAEAFDSEGNLKDEKAATAVKSLGERVARLAAALADG
ncbi:MAG: NAD(P)H-dependent oxidoreductase [Planctomycetes bacterium]|nr:NAD(P)H-dependent oxidoreductase [Planctomycetota bacterium]